MAESTTRPTLSPRVLGAAFIVAAAQDGVYFLRKTSVSADEDQNVFKTSLERNTVQLVPMPMGLAVAWAVATNRTTIHYYHESRCTDIHSQAYLFPSHRRRNMRVPQRQTLTASDLAHRLIRIVFPVTDLCTMGPYLSQTVSPVNRSYALRITQPARPSVAGIETILT
ncbi:hypothetical protein PAXRUDRAFT_723205 [Paxillus rubicundulus Ve08.2h10]|uniref:Unplaced genomic scaffold scaffold_83, whole genome shotgun sequence n=1 Tax=Paxillus rubicundulus Ve08.2h10 TaxID=930991 RepID=A0A0D0DUP3_9AGAM|nr:hypothetical protein PAXRUDRAFT_723205 [Paxillus rubicundulus Ve08.2h10]